MMKLLRSTLFVFALSAGAGAAAETTPLTRLPPSAEASLVPAEQPSGRYTLDTRHASVIWRVRHLGAAPYAGRFDAISGTLDYNAETPTASKVSVSIDAASVSTGLPGDAERKFDRRIADQVFDAANHPSITFESTGLEQISATTGRLSGLLTLAGEAHPITLDVAFEGGRFSQFLGTRVMGFTASGVISRATFGAALDNKLADGAVGDAVELIISAEFHKDRG